MNTDPLKPPHADADLKDSLGIVFNESAQSNKEKQDTKNMSVSPNLKTEIPHAHKSVTSFEQDSLEAGTIVSDRRNVRASLSENLRAAFTEWWTGTKKSLERGFDSALELTSSDTPAETVIPTAVTRADTIKEAAVYTTQAPKDDHSHIREHISNELKTVLPHKNEPVHIKEAPLQPQESVWTHTVLEQKINTPVPHETPTPTTKEIPETNIVVSQIVSKTPLKADVVSQKRPPLPPSPHPAPQDGTMPVKPTFTVPKNLNTAVSTAPIPERVSSKTSTFPGMTVPLPTKQNFDSVQNLPPLTLPQTSVSQNNTLRRILKWTILCLIVLCSAGLAFFASTRFNIFNEPALAPVKETFVIIPKIFETDTQTALTLPLDKASFLAELTAKTQGAPQGISQFYPVVNLSNERRAATTGEIFALLDTHVPNTTVRSLNDVMVVGSVFTSKNEPFMMFQSSRFDVLFSGFLSWENYLQSDLRPLFGEIISSENFTDATIANKSVRILKDVQGNVVLLYAFVDQSTAVITTSREALLKILERF